MCYAQINSKYVCGIDLHAREMYACIMNRTGEILFHRNMRTDFGQFKKKMIPEHFCSYASLVKCERFSAGKHTKGGNQKIGNPYLKWAIADIIIHASHKSQPIGDYYQKRQSRFGKRKAKSIINHKFGIDIYYMLKNNQVFDEKRFVQTNMK